MPEQQQTLTIQQAIDLGVQHHNAGDLTKAEGIYQQILQSDPDQPVALHLLGVIAHQTGNNDVAVDLITKAIAVRPDYAEAHSNLGLALLELKRLDEAVSHYHKAIDLKPDSAEAHNNLGVSLRGLGNHEEAVTSYHNALAVKPDYPDAHYNLGLALHDLGRLEEAVASYRKALTLKPDYAEAHYNLGNALKDQGKLDEAEASYRQAIENDANMGNAYLNLGQILIQLGKLEESYDIQIKGLELTSIETVSDSNLEAVIPKFVKKMQQQNGIPAFFDNYVNMHLTQKPNSPADFCRIFEEGQLSKENRFVLFSQRVKTIPESMPSGRLFGGIPFYSSQGIHSLIKWKEHSLYKATFDLVLYWMIIQEVKPDVIIELGSGEGGSAIWLADMARALGLDTHVYSYDINKPKLNHERVTFIEYDLTEINQQSKPPYWEFFLGKKIVIEDAHVNLKNVLYLFNNILNKDDYLIIEDSDAKQEIIGDFANEKEPKYKLDQFFLDFFGTNITCSKNSIFKVSE